MDKPIIVISSLDYKKYISLENFYTHPKSEGEKKMAKEELTRFPPLWKPKEKGEVLEGEVVASKVDEKYGFSVVIKMKDGQEVTTPAHKNLAGTLKSNFDSQKIKIGDSLTITYLGQRQAKKAKGGMTDPFNDYKVEKTFYDYKVEPKN